MNRDLSFLGGEYQIEFDGEVMLLSERTENCWVIGLNPLFDPGDVSTGTGLAIGKATLIAAGIDFVVFVLMWDSLCFLLVGFDDHQMEMNGLFESSESHQL